MDDTTAGRSASCRRAYVQSIGHLRSLEPVIHPVRYIFRGHRQRVGDQFAVHSDDADIEYGGRRKQSGHSGAFQPQALLAQRPFEADVL